ncbi:MAG TPA: HAD-IA family hydrolase [Rectinemataceae bacterium]|nr:HAD-IA family hydrolase [Rectinemataceae bacterium]
MTKGVLFDVDGVLVDSERFIAEAAVRMFAEMYGVVVDAGEFAPFIGTGEARYLGGVAELHRVKIDIARAKERTYDLYFEVIRDRLRPVAGALELVGELRAAGIRTAVATSADRRKFEANLLEVGLEESSFDAVVTGLDVERKKPFPDIYIEAARRIGLPASECIVVEDAPEGLRAGKAAGARCVGLTTTFPSERLKEAGADSILADLRGGMRSLRLM